MESDSLKTQRNLADYSVLAQILESWTWVVAGLRSLTRLALRCTAVVD